MWERRGGRIRVKVRVRVRVRVRVGGASLPSDRLHCQLSHIRGTLEKLQEVSAGIRLGAAAAEGAAMVVGFRMRVSVDGRGQRV